MRNPSETRFWLRKHMDPESGAAQGTLERETSRSTRVQCSTLHRISSLRQESEVRTWHSLNVSQVKELENPAIVLQLQPHVWETQLQTVAQVTGDCMLASHGLPGFFKLESVLCSEGVFLEERFPTADASSGLAAEGFGLTFSNAPQIMARLSIWRKQGS